LRVSDRLGNSRAETSRVLAANSGTVKYELGPVQDGLTGCRCPCVPCSPAASLSTEFVCFE
jgi:hypothetical protein